ncbi:unnamed protein product [Echinostoma caproni]|uniref:TYR_PHOSPHATASE_2 domain-containing protein n=1 Tax=Echinostoma caproni TaxID=27848 RepID=A0A183AS45_9TREM|nr:unnamed protein product [Echinostoma caproni]
MSFVLERLQWDELTRKRLLRQPLGRSRCILSTSLSQRHLCSGFCGGKRCARCRPFLAKSTENTAVAGLQATWITPNILATSLFKSQFVLSIHIFFNDELTRNSIVAIFNLQEAFEHNACGDGVGASGFSYDPYEFMKHNNGESRIFIRFHFGCGSVDAILDAVTVMQSALMAGKIVVHCHAGLGDTRFASKQIVWHRSNWGSNCLLFDLQ